MSDEELKALLHYVKCLSDYIAAQQKVIAAILPLELLEDFLENVETFAEITEKDYQILSQVRHESFNA